MSRFMGVLTVLGLVAVPVLWIQGFPILAVVAMLIVFTLLVQAACIDFPGSPTYDEMDAPHDRPPSPKDTGLKTGS